MVDTEPTLTDSERLKYNLNGIGRQSDDSLFLAGKSTADQDAVNLIENKFPIGDERYQYGITIGYTDTYIGTAQDKETGKDVVCKITKNFYQPLDTITSVSETLNSQVTSYPMTDKDYVMDHSFSEPMTVSISGSFGLYGRNARIERNPDTTDLPYVTTGDKASYNSPRTRLKRIQETFERLKDDGYILSLTTMAETKDGSGSMVFKRRPSMILTDITWDTGNPSVLGYNFKFKEIRFATISSENDFEIDKSDSTLPNLTDPTELSFGSEVLDFSDIVIEFVNAAFDEEFITKDFISMFVADVQSDTTLESISYSDAKKAVATAYKSGKLSKNVYNWHASDTSYLIAFSFFGLFMGACGKDAGATWTTLGISAGVALAGAITIKVALAFAANPVGAIITGIALAIGAAALVGYTLWKNFVGLNRYSMERFSKHLISSWNHSEEIRFAKLIASLQSVCDSYDSYIKAYTFNSDEDQTCALQINGTIYYFTFTQNTAENSGGYTLALKNGSEKDVESSSNGKITLNTKLVPDNNGVLTMTYLDTSDNNAKDYRLCFIRNSSNVTSFLSNGGDENDVVNHLKNYTMLVTTTDLTKFSTMLTESLENVFMKG